MGRPEDTGLTLGTGLRALYVQFGAERRRHRHYGTAVAPPFGQVRPPGGCSSPPNTFRTFHRCVDNETLFQLVLHAETPLNLFSPTQLQTDHQVSRPAPQRSPAHAVRSAQCSLPPGYCRWSAYFQTQRSPRAAWGHRAPRLQPLAQHIARWLFGSFIKSPANDTACKCSGKTEVAALCLN